MISSPLYSLPLLGLDFAFYQKSVHIFRFLVSVASTLQSMLFFLQKNCMSDLVQNCNA